MQTLPSTRQLQYFLALEEHGHFGRAADACAVSQSAFSHAIRELESSLGVQLVDRTRRAVTITATGREVAAQARTCVREIEALLELTRSRGAPLSGPLMLGAIPTIAPFLLPRLLPELRREHPELEIFLREDKTSAVYDELMEGKLDLLLVALPWPMRNTEQLVLFRDRFHLACSNATRLIDPERFPAGRLPENSVLLLDDGHCLREHALSACKVANLESINQFSASSVLTLLEMIEADLGISFLPEMALAAGALKGRRIETRPMPDNSYRDIGLAWRKGSRRGEEFRAIGEIIRSLA